jgi:hypothetical protein
VTKPAGLFGRFASAIFAPDPLDGPLVTLAKSQPTTAVISIKKSWWKLGFSFAVCLLTGLAAIFIICFSWSSGSVGAAIFFIVVLLIPLFAALLYLRIATCKQPPLVLEPEGLRVNYIGDFIQYDQIADVELYSSVLAGMRLALVPGVKLKSGRTAIGIAELYSFSAGDMAAEIKRRMKIAVAKSALTAEQHR